MSTLIARRRPTVFVPPEQKTSNYNPKFERSAIMGDDILQLIDDSELAEINAILADKAIDYDEETQGKNEEISKKIENMPSIADIVNKIGKEKFFELSEEDKALLFTNPIGSAKYQEYMATEGEETEDTSKPEGKWAQEIRKNFKELGI